MPQYLSGPTVRNFPVRFRIWWYSRGSSLSASPFSTCQARIPRLTTKPTGSSVLSSSSTPLNSLATTGSRSLALTNCPLGVSARRCILPSGSIAFHEPTTAMMLRRRSLPTSLTEFSLPVSRSSSGPSLFMRP
ncbi:MAG: hypothetical protein IPM35_38285 [Myxococcales bacterium]|nr:hypothetical protein [Myxococcales bacterium]